MNYSGKFKFEGDYDGAGHRTKLVGADRGTLQFSFNSLGEVTQEINARKQTINLIYDSLGHLHQRSFPAPSGSGTETQTWTYATSGAGAGHLSSEGDDVTNFSRVVNAWNALGEPTSVSEGPFRPAVGASGSLSSRGLAGEGSLGIGAGGEGDAVVGFQFGNPSSVYEGGTIAFGAGPGGVLTVESGSNGLFVQFGAGAVGGGYVQYSPSVGVNSDGSQESSNSADNTGHCQSSS